MIRRYLIAVSMVAAVAAPAMAWSAAGHRVITYLAMDGAAAELPGWLTTPAMRHQVAYQSNELDRWRGWPSDELHHCYNPNHFLDLELLEEFGLTLDTMPHLRGQYLKALVLAKQAHPERVSAYDASHDRDNTKEWPGFLFQSIAEEYGALQASFNQVRILESLDEPQRAHQLAQARANAVYHMGILSHYIGDMAQPLHTTKHYNGWVGDNPEHYTTDRSFHGYIDGGVVDKHGLTYAALKPLVKYETTVNAKDPWNDVKTYFLRSHSFVEPLYRMQRDGELDKSPGKELIEGRLADASAMLSALYVAAWKSSKPSRDQIAAFVRYNDLKPEDLPKYDEPAGDAAGAHSQRDDAADHEAAQTSSGKGA